MKHCYGRIVLPVFSIFVLFSIITATVAGDARFEVESMNVTVYRDGLVHVAQTLVVNELFPEIILPLLSSSIENVLVLDENETVLDYEISGGNLTVFTLGATDTLVEYDTIALTMKEAEVWTLIVDNPYNLTVFLPQNSTVIYLNKMPTAMGTSGAGITLSLSPGYWEISYVLPLLPDELRDQDGFWASTPIEYLIAIIVTVVVVISSAVFLVRRRRGLNVEKILKAHPQLMKEDKAVIEFLAEQNGTAFEAEIRQRFPDMPRTSLWRLVRRLERLEIVEVRKIGLENQVELKK